MFKRIAPVLACGVIGAMALAGCGSSGSAASGASTASTSAGSGSAASAGSSSAAAGGSGASAASASQAGSASAASGSASGSAPASAGSSASASSGSAASSASGASSSATNSSVGPVPAFPTTAQSSESYKIGFLLPETTTARYENKDKPYFTAALKTVCPNCQLLYANANSNQSTQQQQAESMLTQGAKVLVVDPFDGVAAASIVQAAKAKNVPVVAYDRLIHSKDLAYVVSNNYLEVGKLQGKALIHKLTIDGVKPSDGGIIMINGATTDNNAHNIKKGALSEIKPSGFTVLSETDTWDPAEARTWVASQITRFGKKIVGVYSANDNNAASAMAAFAAAGLPMPPVTGLDASLQGIQNIIAGKQYMTTYNSFKKEAQSAAVAAVDFAMGKTPPSNGTVDGHPAILNQPVAVTIDNIESTIIKDDFWSVSDICTADVKAACQKAGIK